AFREDGKRLQRLRSNACNGYVLVSGIRTRAVRRRCPISGRHCGHSHAHAKAVRMRRRQFASLMKLAVEANGVIVLRTMKLMRGGKGARQEAELMVSEKIHAAIEAAANLMTGASGGEIVHRYRQHVARNAKRLGRLKPSKHRVPKRTGSRRK